jgi:hypothetical protein
MARLRLRLVLSRATREDSRLLATATVRLAPLVTLRRPYPKQKCELGLGKDAPSTACTNPTHYLNKS